MYLFRNIQQNVAQHLKNKNHLFLKEFSEIQRKKESIEAFEEGWKALVNEYGQELQSNKISKHKDNYSNSSDEDESGVEEPDFDEVQMIEEPLNHVYRQQSNQTIKSPIKEYL